MLKNNSTHYGLISRLIHWLMALSIFFMFGLGLYMMDLGYYDAWRKGSVDLHKSIGMLLLLLLVFRTIWSFISTTPTPLAGPKWEQMSAKAVHGLLYLLMFTLMLTGYLISTADGRGIEIFTLVTIPALPLSFDQQEDLSGEIHEILAYLLIALASFHGLAALKHQFINKDGALMRMIKSK